MGKRDNFDSKVSRLDLYVSSICTKLPEDYQEFLVHGRSYTTCLFCLSEEAYNEVRLYDDPNTSPNYVDSGTCCCDSCYGSDVANLYQEIKDHHALEKKRRDGISDFVNHGILHRFWFYHNIIYPKHVQLKTWQCFFCPTSVDEDGIIIDLPVNQTAYMTGGFAKVCEECFVTYEHELANNPNHVETCAECKKNYVITEREFEYRDHERLINNCLCPECTIKNEASLELSFDDNGYRRHRIDNCPFCEAPVGVDLMISEPYHRLVYTHEGKHVCDMCRLSEQDAKDYEATRIPFMSRVTNKATFLFYETYSGDFLVSESNFKDKEPKHYVVSASGVKDFMLQDYGR